MELVLTIIRFCIVISALSLIPVLIWESKSKSKYKIPCTITRLALCIILFVLTIINLIIEICLNHGMYILPILIILIWGLNIRSVSSQLRRKMIQKKFDEDAEIDSFEIVHVIEPESNEK